MNDSEGSNATSCPSKLKAQEENSNLESCESGWEAKITPWTKTQAFRLQLQSIGIGFQLGASSS